MSDIDGLSASLGAFEAALNAKKVDLPALGLSRILLALDGSEQDPTTVAMVCAVVARGGVEVGVLPEGGADPDPVVQALEAAGATAHTLPRPEGHEPFQRILAACEHFGPQLVALPCPFLRNLEAYGHQSVGGTLDVLMARCERALLVTRDPLPSAEVVTQDFLIPVVFDTARNPDAVAWTLELARPGASIRLVEVADTALLDSAAHLLGEYLDAHALDAETLERLEARQHAGLVASLQKAAAERDLSCVVRVQTGDANQVVSDLAAERPTLVVTSCPRDPRHPEFGRVHAALREARGPMLIV